MGEEQQTSTIHARKKKKKTWKIVLLFFILLVTGLTTALVIDTGVKIMAILDMELNIEEAKDSVVLIKSYDKNNELIGTGSGFCTIENNLIATNFHVIEGATRLTITTDDNQEMDITRIVIFNKIKDIAILEGDFQLKPLNTGNTWFMLLFTETELTTISSPGGILNVVGKAINVDGYQDAFEFRGNVDHGSSGGPIFDKRGMVIGIITANIEENENEDEKLNLAINIEELIRLYQDQKNGEYEIIKNDEMQLSSFMPDIFDDKDGNELMITEKWDLNDEDSYVPESMEAYIRLTNSYQIFNRIMEKNKDTVSFVEYYLEFNEQQKELAANYYDYLQSYDEWWCSEENSNRQDEFCLLKENPRDWDQEQMILELQILKRHELAIFAGMAENIEYKDEFKKMVYSLPIEKPKQIIILLVNGSYSTREFTKAENKMVMDYISQLSYSDNEKQEILDKLGY